MKLCNHNDDPSPAYFFHIYNSKLLYMCHLCLSMHVYYSLFFAQKMLIASLKKDAKFP